jgi:hypothetical protein
MDPVRKLTSLPVRRGNDHGLGAPLLALGLLVMGGVLVGFAAVEPSAPEPAAVRFGAAVVIEPGDGSAPGELASRPSWPADSRLQITFRPEQEAWTAVLWFDGPDTVVPLYPRMSQGQWGTTSPGLYVVPSEGAYLRLTTTSSDGDLLAIIDAGEPDREIMKVLMNPDPASVRALRERLEREGAARNRSASAGATERFLPTADGRAVAVPWREQFGTGSVVMTWDVHVE